MAKSKETPKQEERSLLLSESFFEIEAAKRILEECIQKNASIDSFKSVLLLLMRIADEKMFYFDEKYGFEVDENDLFYVEDVLTFAKAREATNK